MSWCTVLSEADAILDLESHGGLYILHSHLNHSCAPNVSVRHLDQRSALARITVIARQTILPGQELTVSLIVSYTTASPLRLRTSRICLTYPPSPFRSPT